MPSEEPAAPSLVRTYVRRALAAAPGAPERLDQVTDWGDALVLLHGHGLAPLAAGLLGGAAEDGGVPPGIVSALNDARTRSQAVHRSALRALGDIGPRLREAGIPYACLKGPHLYHALYSDALPRPYGDIDLMVRRADVERCVPLFDPCSYFPVGSRFDRWLALHAHFHLVLKRNPRGAPPVELHWSLVDRANLYRIDDAAVLARCRESSAMDPVLPVLSFEDLLLYLCLHVAKHGVLNAAARRSGYPVEWFCRPESGNRLLWFLDIDLLLSRETERLDWSAMRERVAQWNVGEDVAATLEVLALMRPESKAAFALAQLGLSDASTAKQAEPFVLCRANTAVAGSVMPAGMRMNKKLLFRPVRLLLLGGLLFPSAARMRAYYRSGPAWMLPLRYVTHPFHMARKLVQ